MHRDELGLQDIGCCGTVMGSPNTVVRAQGCQCTVCVSVGAAVARERNRTSLALVCLQKTVYGANVIVFEGILAFANKELLKVSLPQVATGPGGDVLQQDRHWPGCHCSSGGCGGRGHPTCCQSTACQRPQGR